MVGSSPTVLCAYWFAYEEHLKKHTKHSKLNTMKLAHRLLIIFLLTATIGAKAQVGIGTPNPATSAELDVSSTSKGFLPPRMTEAQRKAIPVPVAGLTIWCTDCLTSGEMQVFNGTDWTNMIGASASPPEAVLICGLTWSLKNLNVDR